MKVERLFKKAGLYFIGNLSSKIMFALIIPIYAFYIDVRDLGFFDYTQTIMWFISPIIFVAIWEAILRFLLYEENELKQKKIITTSIFFTISMSILLIVFLTLYSSFSPINNNLMFFIGMMFLLYSFTQIWQYYARSLEENKLYIFSGIFGTIINFISVLIFICLMKLGLYGLFLSYIIGQLIILIILEYKMRIFKKVRIKYFDFQILKEMLIFSLPLVLNLSAAWFFSGFGRILITQQLGAQMNGLFAFASKFSIIITMLGSVITMAIIEEAIITAKTKGFDENFAKTINFVFKIFLVSTILAVPIINIFYYFIKGTEYHLSLNYALWLLLSAVIMTMASNVGAIFQGIDKTRYQFITTIIGAMVTLSFSYIFISALEVYAIIFGQIFGAGAMLLSRYLFVKRYIYFKIDVKPIILLIISFIMLVTLSASFSLFNNIILFSIMMICLYFSMKNSIKKVFLLFNKNSKEATINKT